MKNLIFFFGVTNTNYVEKEGKISKQKILRPVPTGASRLVPSHSGVPYTIYMLIRSKHIILNRCKYEYALTCDSLGKLYCALLYILCT